MLNNQIEILYTCKQCGLIKQPLAVLARSNEDTKQYIEQTMIEVGRDHYNKSYGCSSITFDIMISTPNPNNSNAKIGGKE